MIKMQNALVEPIRRTIGGGSMFLPGPWLSDRIIRRALEKIALRTMTVNLIVLNEVTGENITFIFGP